MSIKILTIPGYGGSGEEHWQSYWEKEFPNIERVEQADWNAPQLLQWVEALDCVIQQNQQVILVAHSLACALVAHWALRHDTSSVLGAFLVSASDVDSPAHTPAEVRNFSPMPLAALPFKSMLVASMNDPYVSIDRAEQFAKAWGSEFHPIGEFGHINAESKLGSWTYGKTLLNSFLDTKQ